LAFGQACSGALHEQLVPQVQVQISQRQSAPQQQPEAGAVPGALGALDWGALEQHEQVLAVLVMGFLSFEAFCAFTPADADQAPALQVMHRAGGRLPFSRMTAF
jgi:hypothetical protein